MAQGGLELVGGVALASGGEERLAEANSKGISGAGSSVANLGELQGAQRDRIADKVEADSVAEEHLVEETKVRLDELCDAHADARALSRATVDFLRDANSAQGQVNRATVFHGA